MNMTTTAFAAAIAAFALSAPALAQDAEFRLPEQCTTASASGEMDHSAMGHGGQADDTVPESTNIGSMPEHVRENMRRMAITMPAMEEGLMHEDADVAFACAMIAHHQGAIDMAQVLLEHGDDPQMIELAGEIVAAQVGEIEKMATWLVENAE
jgi:uncharacterized protein (DUF305 family)